MCKGDTSQRQGDIGSLNWCARTSCARDFELLTTKLVEVKRETPSGCVSVININKCPSVGDRQTDKFLGRQRAAIQLGGSEEKSVTQNPPLLRAPDF